MHSKIYGFVVIALCVTGSVMAQLNAAVIGDAIDQGNNCYTITQNLEFQAGGVWYNNPIDFDEDFTILYQNNFGALDANGADGMALVFKGNPTPELGNAGGGVGYEGISPSLVIEFDTYQNGDLGDPFFDHISIMRNGSPNHNSGASNLSGPIQASATSANIEDGNTHEIKIEWNATTNILSVFFDCELRLTLNQDVKNVIFSGDDSVFFGFVGSTGGLTNIHEVCFNSISFVDNLQIEDDFICEGSSKVIDATIPSGETYSWSPINGVSNPNIANPTLSPNTNTTYTVTIADVCGNITEEEFTLFVLPIEDPIFDAVAPICEGDALDNLPTTSNNGLTGTWSPALNNTQTTTYTFTPNNLCATSTTLEIVVNPLQFPTFDPVDPICEGDALAPLPTTSTNGITGTWAPALNPLATTTYTFTPDAGQICAQETTLEVVVNPILTPTFQSVGPICEGDTGVELPTTSTNGIAGTWSPEIDNTTTTTYTFTPNVEECAIPTTLQIEVVPNEIPVFDAVPPICEGDTLNDLPTISNNGISGAWTPELNNTETTIYTFTPSGNQCAVEVTLTVEVIPNEIPLFDAVGPVCPGQFIADLPVVSLNGISGTWTPELNNVETTVYTFTPEPGQGCVVSTTLEIVVTEPIVPSFDAVGPICTGDNLDNLPIVSNDGITGVWTPDLNNLETTTYTFTPNANQCAGQTTLTVEVIPISELSLEVEVVTEPFSDNQTVVATVIGGTGTYEYQLDGGPWVETNVFRRVSGCEEHIIRARESSGCSNVASETFRILEYPKFFTPNGDSDNDFWNITCLRNQPNARISIFDRYGKILATIRPTRSGWDGAYNGALMPANDYWFKVDYFNENGSPRVFTSHFTLKR
ncbi:lectin-like domain-containing protein [Winogradskyella aurantia]|uniref:T9SS type B sorting domain-containing protein n=1 Tax=Winogradskyella aurantia TaxID=1915063 RepID=A0A265UZN5_9FLAO|nr:T9SS type B sorting domain-containing protein [Winogradskyella aurantia]OZV70682.1 hypothetical protein CA834_00785 [Winogradskyella aurantia]